MEETGKNRLSQRPYNGTFQVNQYLTMHEKGGFFIMGVNVREKPKGSGVFWVFVNYNGQRKSKKIGNDKKIALEVAEKIKARLVLGELDIEKINNTGPCLKELAEIWLAMHHDWKDSTRETYTANLEKHIFPKFGKARIQDIRRKDIRSFFDQLFVDGLNPNTLKLIRASFRGVMSYALDCEIITSNPFSDLRMGYKKRSTEIKPLNDSEANLLLNQAELFMDGKYYPPILLALRTGLRIGELQALKWEDIDFDRRQIEVKRSWRKGRFSRTKNKKKRRVDMTPHVAETLRNHRIKQKRKALKEGRPFSEYVFIGERDELLNRITFKNAVDRCTDAASLRNIRVHDLRHSYATTRLMRGHNVGDVSYQLGHSSIKITYDVYVHWIPGQFKSEIDDLDQVHPNAPLLHPKKKGDLKL